MKNSAEHNLLLTGSYRSDLAQNIQKEYNKLIEMVIQTIAVSDTKKIIDFGFHVISCRDIIAYQIGWGRLLVSWYRSGVAQKKVDMPGEGFKSWDYTGLAECFYKKYHYTTQDKQLQEFHALVIQIIDIVEHESVTGNLLRVGVWDWCTLPSGKKCAKSGNRYHKKKKMKN